MLVIEKTRVIRQTCAPLFSEVVPQFGSLRLLPEKKPNWRKKKTGTLHRMKNNKTWPRYKTRMMQKEKTRIFFPTILGQGAPSPGNHSFRTTIATSIVARLFVAVDIQIFALWAAYMVELFFVV